MAFKGGHDLAQGGSQCESPCHHPTVSALNHPDLRSFPWNGVGLSHSAVKRRLMPTPYCDAQEGDWFVRQSTRRAGGYTLDIRFDGNEGAVIVSFRITNRGGVYTFNHGQKWSEGLAWVSTEYATLLDCLQGFGTRVLDISAGTSAVSADSHARLHMARSSLPSRDAAAAAQAAPPRPRAPADTPTVDPSRGSPGGGADAGGLTVVVQQRDSMDARIDEELARIKGYYPGIQPPPRPHRPSPLEDALLHSTSLVGRSKSQSPMSSPSSASSASTPIRSATKHETRRGNSGRKQQKGEKSTSSQQAPLWHARERDGDGRSVVDTPTAMLQRRRRSSVG